MRCGGQREDRFVLAGDGWVRPDGLRLFEDPADLLTGEPRSALMVEADGLTYTESSVWTGAVTPGDLGSGTSCSGWTSSDPTDTAMMGDSNGTTFGFFDGIGASTSECSAAMGRLDCLEE